jgi:hypothetical protein
MTNYALWLLWAATAFAADPAGGWKPWAPRPEIAPRTYMDPLVARVSGGSLTVSGRRERAWHRTVRCGHARWRP